MEKCVVLLSSGLDSSVNLLLALQQYQVVAAITFNYGQKSAEKEIFHSQQICKDHNIKHIIVDLRFFKDFTSTSLVSDSMNIPDKNEVQLTSSESNTKTAAKVWVPNRNGIFLNIAAGYAEGLGAKYVVPGFNLEESETFPDNSQAYQDTLNAAFSLSTQNKVEVLCFTQTLVKSEILKKGLEHGLKIENVWPCYNGHDQWCMNCESCLRFQRAATDNNISLSALPHTSVTENL